MAKKTQKAYIKHNGMEIDLLQTIAKLPPCLAAIKNSAERIAENPATEVTILPWDLPKGHWLQVYKIRLEHCDDNKLHMPGLRESVLLMTSSDDEPANLIQAALSEEALWIWVNHTNQALAAIITKYHPTLIEKLTWAWKRLVDRTKK